MHAWSMACLVALAATASACHAGGSARLQGTWKGIRAEGVSLGAVTAANGFATGLRLEIHGDALTLTTPKVKQSDRYHVTKEDDAGVVITTDKDGPDEPQTFTFVDDTTLRWTVGDGQTILFARQ